MPKLASILTLITAPLVRKSLKRRQRLWCCTRRRALNGAGFERVQATLARVEANLERRPGDTTTLQNALEEQLDAEIDGYRELANGGKPKTAKPLLEALLGRVLGSASGR